MKRAAARGKKTVGGWARMGREWDLLDAVRTAFLALSWDAGNLAYGRDTRTDFSPDSFFARRAREAAEYAEAHPTEHPYFPDPLAELSRALHGVAVLSAECARGGKQGTMARMCAVELAARCRMLYAVAGMRADALTERERGRLESAAELATVKAQLADVKGDKAAFRKWKREEKAARQAVRVLDVKYLLGEAGWTVQQVADKWGVSVRTVEGLAQKARAWKILGKRTPGRRGPGRLAGGKAGEIALEHATSEPGED